MNGCAYEHHPEKINWSMDASDILHVTQLPKALPFIPSAPTHIKGLIQQDGDVYTVFDLGYILNGVPTPMSKSNRVLILQPGLMPGRRTIGRKNV